jgi:hypothetical protein
MSLDVSRNDILALESLFSIFINVFEAPEYNFQNSIPRSFIGWKFGFQIVSCGGHVDFMRRVKG